MQYLQYFENYDKEGLIRKFYENALHHDDVNAIENINQKYNTNPLDFINRGEIIEYNAYHIFDYLIDNLRINFSEEYLKYDIFNKGKFKIAKILYNNGYYNEYIKNIGNIDIADKNIKTLEGVEIFQGLMLLYCNNNQIQSIEPLRYLTELEALNISDNKIQTIKPIEHLLPQIEDYFDFANNPLNKESRELLKKYNFII